MALKKHQQRLSWPAVPIDPEAARVTYDVPADEFLIYFGGKPVPMVSSPLNAPDFQDVAVMFGLGPNRVATNEIVGIHVMPMTLGAVPAHPHWARLVWAVMAGDYGTELLKERLPLFIDEVAEAFRLYWKPAPPIEEQLAALQRGSREQRSA